jgi:hypothetical protein
MFVKYGVLCQHRSIMCAVEPGYNDIGLCDNSPVASDILWCQLILSVIHNSILLAYNDTHL